MKKKATVYPAHKLAKGLNLSEKAATLCGKPSLLVDTRVICCGERLEPMREDATKASSSASLNALTAPLSTPRAKSSSADGRGHLRKTTGGKVGLYNL